MIHDDIFKKLSQIISEHFSCDIDKINKNTTAPQILGWDSLAHTIIMMKIEDNFNIEFSDEFIFSVKNIGELSNKIAELINE